MKGSRMLIVLSLAAAPLLSSAAAVVPARAETACLDVWLVRSDGSRQYVAGPGNCVETGMTRWFNFNAEPTSELVPGPYIGAGFDTWVTSP